MANRHVLDRTLLEMDVKTELFNELDGIGTANDIDFGIHATPSFSDPELHVDGNRIYFPLSEEDARLCIHVGHQAPFGKKDATIVDRSVRKTWELDPSDFEIRSPQWDEYLKMIVKGVAKDMDVSQEHPGFHPELYKMLLYEEGAMFKAHQDTEKVPGMFATLIVPLPSTHTGGSVRIRRPGHTDEFLDTCGMGHGFLWWYSDISHEILPVESGIRWVLTYNLVRDNPHKALSEFTPDSSECQRILQAYRFQREHGSETVPHVLVHLLEHQYTEANLKLPLLKSQDLRQALVLKEACDKTKCHMFLATFEHMKHGPTVEEEYGDDNEGHLIDEVLEEETHFTALYDEDGNKVAGDTMALTEYLLDEEAWNDAEPDKEDYEGYQGNWGCTATHWYHRTAIVIVPEEELLQFLNINRSTRTSSTLPVLRYLVTRSLAREDNAACERDLRVVCKIILGSKSRDGVPGGSTTTQNGETEVLPYIIAASILLDDIHLCNQALAVSPSWDDYSLKRMGSVIQHYGFSHFRNVFDTHFQRLTFGVMFHALSILLTNCSNTAGAQCEPIKELSSWGIARLDKAVSPDMCITHEDADSLLQFYDMDEGAVDRRRKIEKIIHAHCCDGTFATRFLNSIFDKHGNAGEDHHNILDKWFQIGMPDGSLFRLIDPPWADATNQNKNTPPLTGGELGRLLDRCYSLGYHAFVEMVLATFKLQQNVATRDHLLKLYIPCLQELVLLIPGWGVRYTDPFYQSLFQTTLEALVKSTGAEPTKSQNWARSALGCDCSTCRPVNAFLISPYLERSGFPASKSNRHHLHMELEDSGIPCTHLTDRSGRGDTLIVTKKKLRGQDNYKIWQQKVQETKDLLRTFHPNTLKSLLGEKYDDIMQMRALKPTSRQAESVNTKGPPGAGPSSTLRSTTANAQKPTGPAGRKRKADEIEVIDLT